MTSDIAIVGMACRYPDASSPLELWENVLAQRRAFRQIPAERLRLADYFSADPQTPDRTYATQAALIKDYRFDRVRFRVAGSAFRTADLTHWLALDVAAQALADAGWPEGEGLTRETTGVILGNTLTGEFSRSNLMRLRWPYVRRVMAAALVEQGWSAEQRRSFLERLEVDYKAPFPPIGEESLAGGLSNTIAGRICNYFDFKGGGYTVDGACASSLLAITTACSALVAGDIDVALAGGVDISLDPFELVGFAKTAALASTEMRVYDARSAGFWPGEGCGLMVLMRSEEAVARRRRVYALIRGWGVSSDGRGGLTRPEVAGQMLAVRRAYRRAGFGIETVGYFEGHGTGTAVGDAVELRTLSAARREMNPSPPAAVIGSIKANIGHTKAAAGVAGAIKAVMALQTQLLPPTTGCDTPHPELKGATPALQVLSTGRDWPADRPLRAGVSAMGFGGVNTHIVLEGTQTGRRKRLSRREQRLLASPQDGELFLFSAPAATDLQQQLDHLLTFAEALSLAELTDLAACLQQTLTPEPVRAAVIAAAPTGLVKGLKTLRLWLADGVMDRLDFRTGVFLGDGVRTPRLGFLFPGQGAPVYGDGGVLARRFPCISDLYRRAGLSGNGASITAAGIQPAIVAASAAALQILNRLGIKAETAVGHSLGELTALYWAGAMDEETALDLAAARGRMMAELAGPTGAMAGIGAGADVVETLLAGTAVVIACLNTPRQTVISGEAAAVTAVVAQAQAQGLTARMLPVSHAFHSPLVAAAGQPLARRLGQTAFQPLQRTVISTVTGAPLAPTEDLRALLQRQVTAPVRFTEAIAAVEKVDLFIEVGPGRVLSGLAADCGGSPGVALDAGGPSLTGLLQAVGAAFALGVAMNHDCLFADRFTRPFDLDWRPRFFVNPCELAPLPDLPDSEAAPVRTATPEPAVTNTAPPPELPEPEAASLRTATPEPAATNTRETAPNFDRVDRPRQTTSSSLKFEPEIEQNGALKTDVVGVVRRLVAARVELPLAAINNEDRLLSDLRLNSIAVSQLVAEAARSLDLPPPVAPTEFADVSVNDVAQTLAEIVQNGGEAPAEPEPLLPPGVDTWVRSFTVVWVRRPLSPGRELSGSGRWQVIASSGHPLEASLRQACARLAGGGVVVCLPPDPDERCLGLLLAGAQAVAANGEASRFVLVQHGGGGAAFARTLHLETPGLTTCIVNVPPDHPQAVTWVLAEIRAATGYVEARYDSSGLRRTPVLRLLSWEEEGSTFPLGPDDVLLATGGGKGVTAECALGLARETGVRLALIGRSRPEADSELAANLDRMASDGLLFRYIPADVTDPAAVQAAVREVESSLGAVTGLLHGAARNTPQRLATLDEAACRRTLAPKVQGLRHLLAAVEPDRLRLVVAFGSIIARTGLPGEADYGLANEWLARLVEQFQQDHPRCRCLTVEWSVWVGVGMGDRLGRLEALVRQGVTPIPIDTGLAALRRLLTQTGSEQSSALPTSVVVTGRFGRPPTLRLEQPDLPFQRFLEQARIYYPGVELVVEATLSTETDPYLADHVFQGTPLFPAVMGLEAMAQAAMAVAGTTEPPWFEAVQFKRPVVVPTGETMTIRLAALVRRSGSIEVVLHSQETAFQTDHFRAICRFGAQPADSLATAAPKPLSRLDLDPDRALYGRFLFQTGRFRRLQGYRQVTARACQAELSPSPDAAWFSRYLPAALVLGDPGARDAAIHALQIGVPQATLLPIGVERLLPGVMKTTGPCFVHARERSRQADIFIYDVLVTDAEGRVREQWQGLQLKKAGHLPAITAWPIPLLGPYLERCLQDLLPGSTVTVVAEPAAATDRRSRSDLALRRALGRDASIRRRPDGKPEAGVGWAASTAHTDALTLAVAAPEGEGVLGCDVEPVVSRPAAVWQDLLGLERFKLASVAAEAAAEDVDTAATRVWCAGECLKKAGAAVAAPLVMAATPGDGWVLFSTGSLVTATVITQIQNRPDRLALAVLIGN